MGEQQQRVRRKATTSKRRTSRRPGLASLVGDRPATRHAATLAGLLALGALALVLVYARPLTQTIAVGANTDRAATEGFLARELGSDGVTYRWTDDRATLIFRAAGLAFPANRPVALELTLAASRPAGVNPPTVVFDLDGAVIDTRAIAGASRVSVATAARGDGPTDRRATITSETFTPPGDRRILGVAILGAARLAEGPGQGLALPPLGAWWRWLATLASGWGVAVALLRRPGRTTLAGGLWLTLLTGGALVARPQFWELIHLPLLLLIALLPLVWRAALAHQASALLGLVERRWGLRVPVVALLGAVALGVAQALLTSGREPRLALGLGALGLIALLATLTTRTDLNGETEVARAAVPLAEPSDTRLDHRLELALLVAILLLATGARFFRLGDIPFGMWRDEARHGLEALRILDDPNYRPVYVPNISLPGLYPLLLAGVFNVAGPSLTSLRGLTAAGGVGAVAALWLVARQLWGPRVALVAATLAAVGSWRVSIDRLAFDTGPTTLCTLGAFALFLVGVAQVRAGVRAGGRAGWREMAAFAGAGFLGALAIYGYYPGRFALPTLAGAAIVLLLRERDGFARRLAPGLLLAAVIAALTLVPLGRYAVEQPDLFFKRTEQVFFLSDRYLQGQTTLGAIEQSLLRHAVMFNWQGETNARHHLPRWPMLDAVTAACFALGLALTLVAALRFSFPALFALGWLLALLAPSIVSIDAPSAVRAQDAAPAAYLLAAVGLVALWQRLRALDAPGWTARAAPALVGAALAAVVAINLWIYFVRTPGDPRVLGKFQYVGETRAGLAIRAERERTPTLTTYLSGFFLANGDAYGVLRFTSGDATLRELPSDAAALPPGPLLIVVPRAEEQNFDQEVATARRIAAAAGLREVPGERPPGGGNLTYIMFVRDLP